MCQIRIGKEKKKGGGLPCEIDIRRNKAMATRRLERHLYTEEHYLFFSKKQT